MCLFVKETSQQQISHSVNMHLQVTCFNIDFLIKNFLSNCYAESAFINNYLQIQFKHYLCTWYFIIRPIYYEPSE